MFSNSRGKTPLFPLLLLAFAAPNASFSASCDNARLQEMMKPELDVEQAETQCLRSTEAEASFGKISIPNRDRSRQLTVSCCAAAHILVHEEVEGLLERERAVCAQAQRAPSAESCGAVQCLQEVESFYTKMNSAETGLADYLREMRKAAEPCGPAFERVKQAARNQMAQVHAELNRLPVGLRADFLKAESLRAR